MFENDPTPQHKQPERSKVIHKCQRCLIGLKDCVCWNCPNCNEIPDYNNQCACKNLNNE